MTEPHATWTVLPHGPLQPVGDDMLTVTGTVEMPIGAFERRMTVVRLADRRLVVWSAIALDDAAMAQLEAFGTPAFLVIPSDHHRLDAHAWKARYPQLTVATPPGAREKVADTVIVDTTAPDFGDPSVRFAVVPGTRGHEGALVIDKADGTTLVLNDVVANIRGEHGFAGWLLRVAGFAGDHAQIPLPVKALIVDDRAALRTQLLDWAALPRLARIVVSHGEPVTVDAAGVLRELATTLE